LFSRAVRRIGAVEFVVDRTMKELSLPFVSVSSSGDEYFQVEFAAREDDGKSDYVEHDYLLVQRQFESYDGGRCYLESHDQDLCGHFKIRRATLGRDFLRLELAGGSTETVQIRFQTGISGYHELRRVLEIIVPSRVLQIEP
jgi:hypothetical protein